MEARNYLAVLTVAVLYFVGSAATDTVATDVDYLDSFNAIDDSSEVSVDANGRILGGTPVGSPNLFRYQAAILEKLRHVCGGSLIDDRHVLTAATCVTNANGNVKSAGNFHVGVGHINLNDYNETIAYQVSNIFIHEEFNISRMISNIAVIRISGYFRYGLNVQPIPLSSSVINQYSRMCDATGFGATWTNPVAPDMQELYQRIVNASVPCSGISPLPSSKVFCASESFTGLCGGDIGGPLACSGVLEGIASHSQCSYGGKAVYTRVYDYTKWIQEVTDRDSATAAAPGVLSALLVTLALAWSSA